MAQQPHLNSQVNTQDDNLDLLVRHDDEPSLSSQKTKRHTSFVRLMRLILPVVALGVVVVLVTWTNDGKPVAPVPRESISPQTIAKNELVKPKFQSEDSNSQPYTITADKATQNAEDMNVVLLDKPVADMTLKSGGWVSLKADNGAYKQGERNLALSGQVEMRHNNGYALKADSMDIDITAQRLVAASPVFGDGPAATIEATGLEADGATDIIIFKGPAKLILRKASAVSTPAEISPISSPVTEGQ